MEDKILEIKKTISLFLNTEVQNINDNTLIDNSVIQGSVKIHMMYADLADKGIKIENYSSIKTFGNLLEILKFPTENGEKGSAVNSAFPVPNINFEHQNQNIGIDIAKISDLPKVEDFRESGFYKDNFSKFEISYCLTKVDPYISFAGKFAAKEALVKADNRYKNIPFNKIEIGNEDSGKPVFKEYLLSISHTGDYAIAVAQRNTSDNTEKELKELQKKSEILENTINELKNVKTPAISKKIKLLIFASLALGILSLFSQIVFWVYQIVK